MRVSFLAVTVYVWKGLKGLEDEHPIDNRLIQKFFVEQPWV